MTTTQRAIDVVVFAILNDYKQLQAAQKLGLTTSTVNSYFIEVKHKANVKTTGALALWLLKNGHIPNV